MPRSLDLDLPHYTPPPALGGGRRMTLLAAMPRPWLADFAAAGRPREFVVEPGTRVLGLCHWQAEPQSAPTAVLMHGLTGSAESAYVVGTAQKLVGAGFNVVRLNARNCGGTEHLSQTLYHAAMAGDPIAVLRELAEVDRLPRLYLVGFSMGGSISLLAATRVAELPTALRGLAVVSPPLDLDACSWRLEANSFNRGLGRRFLREFRDVLAERERHHGAGVDLAPLESISTIREFDSLYTAPLGGFDSLEHYYATGTVRGRLHLIDRPGLLIHAIDDPIVDPAAFLEPELADHPTVHAQISTTGGHVGFVGGRRATGPRGLDPDRRWAENRIVDFLVALELEQGQVPARVAAEQDGTPQTV
ncbi:YheT family hydrolase [Engelhardtia mirabilis]|uniref:Putative hydrolase n=1 Tax=Engelhardtia mirabilis TaxID=2528011 RepID=A0A518BFM9_9BACT|nr:putative hydrolase [Planctomycetes bacterium Pla133]QDV00116.1 putative hydrolase [Planctomycetes bacterium Pla86]